MAGHTHRLTAIMGITYKTGIKPDMARLYDAINFIYPNYQYKADAARLLNTSEQVLTNWESRGISSAGVVEACEKINGLNPVWLRTGIGGMFNYKDRQVSSNLLNAEDVEKDYVGIKRVDLKISAGVSGYAVEYLDGQRSPIFFRRDWLEKNGYDSDKLYAVEVSGESMLPSLWHGDLVVINAADTRLVDGEVYAVNYDGELVIKRLIKEAGQWWLSSDNPDKRRFQNKVCHESAFIIGRIIYKQSERI